MEKDNKKQGTHSTNKRDPAKGSKSAGRKSNRGSSKDTNKE